MTVDESDIKADMHRAIQAWFDCPVAVRPTAFALGDRIRALALPADPEFNAVKMGHIHVAGTTVGKHIDECAKCGFDLRHPIHSASARGAA